MKVDAVLDSRGSSPSVHYNPYENPSPRELQMELESVLQQDFAFPGTYHQVMEHLSCPHLGLRVDGLEDVSLPLNDQSARAIHALADSCKNGSGRSFLELGTGFSFIKPEWNIWLQTRMREELLRKVLPEDCPVAFKLSKLMLWEADADAPEHSCKPISKSETEFATIVVVLPSKFSGGNVHFCSHGSKQSYPTQSRAECTMLSIFWYDGLDCSFQPIISGRRLALAYRLVYTGQGSPPSLREMQGKTNKLGLVLSKWTRMRAIDVVDLPATVAYPLQHDYPMGRQLFLRGHDSHRLRHLRTHCADFGIEVVVGVIKRRSANETIRQDNTEADSMVEDPPKPEKPQPLAVISSITNIDGAPLATNHMNVLHLHAPDILCSDPQSSSSWVLALYHQQCTDWIKIKNALHDKKLAFEAYLNFLCQSLTRDLTNQPPHIVKLEEHARERMHRSLPRTSPFNLSLQSVLASLAILRNDYDSWNSATVAAGHDAPLLQILRNVRWLDAWNTFSLEKTLETLNHCWSLRTFHECISAVVDIDAEPIPAQEERANGVTQKGLQKWTTDQLKLRLGLLDNLRENDVAPFIRLLFAKGQNFFIQEIYNHCFHEVPDSEFFIAFISTLSRVHGSPYQQLIELCLRRLLEDLKHIARTRSLSPEHQSALKARGFMIYDYFLSIRRHQDVIDVLIESLDQIQGLPAFNETATAFHLPLVGEILLKRFPLYRIQPWDPPFKTYYARLVSFLAYFCLYCDGRSLLEMKRGKTPQKRVLDTFLYSTYLDSATFCGPRSEINLLIGQVKTTKVLQYRRQRDFLHITRSCVQDLYLHLKVNTRFFSDLRAFGGIDSVNLIMDGFAGVEGGVDALRARFALDPTIPRQVNPLLQPGLACGVYYFKDGEWVLTHQEVGPRGSTEISALV